MAVYPLAMPLMASPMGLVTLTTISAQHNLALQDLGEVAIVLLAVMAINLVALLSVQGVSKHVGADALDLANRVPALLLAALAMETLIGGGADLIKGAAEQLKG